MAKIIGDRELRRKLKSLTDYKFLRPTMQAVGAHMKGKAAIYPDSSIANTPKTHGSWYERGFGTKYRRLDGNVTGRHTSETLGRRWTFRTEKTGIGVTIGNNVSYGPYVQGEDQASFHARRSWKTVDDVADEQSDFVLKTIKRAVDRQLAN